MPAFRRSLCVDSPSLDPSLASALSPPTYAPHSPDLHPTFSTLILELDAFWIWFTSPHRSSTAWFG